MGILLEGAILMTEVAAQQSGLGCAIEYASEELKADGGAVAEGVKQCGAALGCECVLLRGRPREPDKSGRLSRYVL